jgi:hypothetical protein
VFLFALFMTAPVAADQVVYWPATGQRVYIVDSANIGAYGKITKPPGIDVIVVRHNGKWGVLPPNLYQSKPQPQSSLRFDTRLPTNSGRLSKPAMPGQKYQRYYGF